MRWLLLVLVACTSTRQLADVDTLRGGGRSAGWVVGTTERWKERIDPMTDLQLQRGDGAWTEVIHAHELKTDGQGLWVDQYRKLGEIAERIVVEEITDDVVEIIANAKPESATLRFVDGAHVMIASHADLTAWIDAIVREVIRQDDPKLRMAAIQRNENTDWMHHVDPYVRLGRWRAFAPSWSRDLRGPALDSAFRYGVDARLGWRWSDITKIEVTNLSGTKTLVGLVATAAIAAALTPFALLIHSFPTPHIGASPHLPDISTRTGADPHAGEWRGELATTTDARPLFTRGAIVRGFVQPTLSFDTSAAYRGDLLAAGAIAKLRIAQFWEIGGGVREVANRGTSGVFATGLHLPLDAAGHFALPLGFEVASGAGVHVDLRIPIGLRYSTDHWFATVSPAVPEYLHLVGEPRRWSWAGSLELGYAF